MKKQQTVLQAKPTQSKILFFDGVCSLCNRLINFLIFIDKNNVLQFASLQGETAKKELSTSFIKQLNTIVYKENNTIYTESEAVIYALTALGGIFKMILIFKIIPKPVRDKIYYWVAANRYKWFGKKDICRMPTPEELHKILP